MGREVAVTVRKAIFPVAGLGTRFLPATKSIPKEILTLVDRPLIDYAVEEARAAGIKDFIFVTSRGKSALSDYFDDAPELEARLEAAGKWDAMDTDGTPLIEGRTVTGVTDAQIDQLGISITPKHPESELRAANANFESGTAFRDIFATHVSVDGNLVTGQNQNSGAEAAHRMLEILAE